MTTTLSARLDRALGALPRSHPGPGGAAAVLREGEVLERHAWGWANAERRIPFTPKTLFRMCSITKQFTCALVLDACPDPSALDAAVRARLPRLEQPAPETLRLCHNQSGLRDYWAVAMLHGSPAEAFFGDAEAARVIAGTRSLHFTPGTRFSYVNQNFRILCDILQARTGRGFAELLRTRIFDRAGMGSALLAADTTALPDGAEGYEGTPTGGFRPAVNRILWTGDAGLAASLDDMIAWERHVDATREDAGALYSRLSAPVTFADGAPATYGFGLGRSIEFGRAVTRHGGGLRGWSSHRMYVPAERISIVVMFNHHSEAAVALVDLLGADAGRGTAEVGYVAAGAGLARRLYRAGNRARGAHRGCGGGAGAAALRPHPGTARHQGGRHLQHRPRDPAAASRWRALDGSPHRRTTVPACNHAKARKRPTSPAAIAARNWTPR